MYVCIYKINYNLKINKLDTNEKFDIVRQIINKIY